MLFKNLKKIKIKKSINYNFFCYEKKVNRHKTLLELINNPKKKAKHSYTYI